MKRTKLRNGSALLIVLGLLSFMVVSAVGFSIFMRESRKPSSHLRRSITARFMLRAALANAIARLDGDIAKIRDDDGKVTYYLEGIYDDLYPGVGPSLNDTGINNDRNGDHWDKRVFMPRGPVHPRYTVSTLTLEGLAYLPPAIINEVRVWSRQTRTAEWKNLAYDLGRYAFCAVDVSDCFDINKVRANERRTSAANHRVNLSSLFPDNADKLDELLERGAKQNPPSFFSLADYNIIGQDIEQGKFTPWMNFIGGGNKKQIYTRENDELFVSNALFITDTWFPPTNTVGSAQAPGNNLIRNLEAGLPWSGNKFPDRVNSALEPLNFIENKDWGLALYKMLQGVGIACLYDYLDEDQVPLSYCLPCTETAPMVCALGIDRPSVTMAFKKEDNVAYGDYGSLVLLPGKAEKEPQFKVTVKRCYLEVNISELIAKGVMVFPFKRADVKEKYKEEFSGLSGEALIRVFFAPKNLKSRLHAGSGNAAEYAVYPRDAGKWNPEDNGWKNGVYSQVAEILPASSSEKFDFASKEVAQQKDALREFLIRWRSDGERGSAKFTLFYYVEQIDKLTGSVADSWYCFDGISGAADAFQPRSVNGRTGEDKFDRDDKSKVWEKCLTGDYPTAKAVKVKAAAPSSPAGGVYTTDESLPSGKGVQKDLGAGLVSMYPHAAVWVRLFNGDNTYDIVPARSQDDIIYGDRAPITNVRDFEDAFYDRDDDGEYVVPILEFRDALAISPKDFPVNGDSAPSAQIKFDADWNRLYVADPRYNFAPENWFAVKGSDGNVTKELWLNAIDALLGIHGSDRDIFMFTSDQEYLQSIEELAFLPRVGDAAMPPGQINRYYLAKSDFAGEPFGDRIVENGDTKPGSPEEKKKRNTELREKLAQGDLYWRTYSTYPDPDGGKVDDVHVLRDGTKRYEIVSGNNDFRANPFSRDQRVIAAVVEGTPFDYFAASTNELNTLYAKPDEATPKDAEDYVFTGEDSGSAGYIEGFSKLVGAIQDEFAQAARDAKASDPKTLDWREIYDNRLQWASKNCGDEQKDIFGINLGDPLHGVDRKFLHAFWRECFQNRQQLFLIFLRAEPLTVGGMGFGSLAAAQLGARGVALVWRDPEPPGQNRDQRTGRSGITGPKDWRNVLNNSGPHRTRVLFYHPID